MLGFRRVLQFFSLHRWCCSDTTGIFCFNCEKEHCGLDQMGEAQTLDIQSFFFLKEGLLLQMQFNDGIEIIAANAVSDHYLDFADKFIMLTLNINKLCSCEKT